MDHLTIIYEQGEQGWWVAHIPEVPGAVSQGRTMEEAKEMVLDALRELSLAREEFARKEMNAMSKVESLPLKIAI